MNVVDRLKNILTEEILIEANNNINYLIKKYPNVRDIQRYLKFDPTYEGGDIIGKNTEWIVNQVKKGNIKPTDKDMIHELLTDFGMQMKRNTLKGNDRSILSYKSVEDLKNKLDAVKSTGVSTKVNKGRNVSAKPIVGTEIVYADDDWTIYIPYTYTGSVRAASLGGDRAAWCTANPQSTHYWESYSSRGPLYIIVNNKDNTDKYQLNIDIRSGSPRIDGHMDRHDYPFNVDAFLSDKPEMKEFFDGELQQDSKTYFTRKGEMFLKQLEQDKVYDGLMEVSKLGLSTLPEGFTVNGDLVIKNTKFSMPKNLTVHGKCVIGAGTGIQEITDLVVDGILNLLRSDVKHLENVKVGSFIITPDGRGRLTTSERFTNVHKFNRYMETRQ